jgi:hypothetical protein
MMPPTIHPPARNGQYPILEKIETADRLLAEPEPALEWAIENFWVANSRGFIAGNPGVGKTWIALDMLIASVTGCLCLGRYDVKHLGPGLLIEEESSRHNLQRRLHALARGRGLEPDALKDLHTLTRAFVKIPQEQKALISFIKDHGIRMVVFDSLRRVHDGKESSSDEMAPILESFARINHETGANLVLIHHLAKSGTKSGSEPRSIWDRVRGTGDLWAWRDCALGVETTDDPDAAVCNFQLRDAETQAPVTIRRISDPLTGAIRLEAQPQEETEEFRDLMEDIRDVVRTQLSPKYKAEILKAIKGRNQDKIRAFDWLVRKGEIRREGRYWGRGDGVI